MGRHDDSVIWVTGAASGIGRATAEVLAEEGARVLATDVSEDGLAWAAGHNRIATQVCDVTVEADNVRAVQAAVARFGKLTGAVLNAGIVQSAPIDAADGIAILRRTLEVNVIGVAMGIRAALPALRANGGGAITATASTSGLGGDPNLWTYNASKGGVANLVRAAAVELGAENIRVNAVAPGPTESGMTRGLLTATANPASEALRVRIPLKRWARAREQATVHAFLVSDDASFINGVILPVDGGITANTGQFEPGGRGPVAD